MAHFILQYVPDRPIKWLTTRLLTSELSVIIVQTLSFGFCKSKTGGNHGRDASAVGWITIN